MALSGLIRMMDVLVEAPGTPRQKSIFATVILFIILMLLLFFLKFGNASAFAELEGGGGGGGDIAVNFGDSDVGMGDNFESTQSAASAPKPVAKPVEANEILTSSSDDAPVIKDVKKPAETPKKTETKPVEKPATKPTPSKSTQSALDNLLGGKDNSGDGTDNVGGNKGKAYGSTSNRGYDGGGGSGGGDGTGTGTGQGAGSGSGSGGGSGSGRGTGVGNYQLAGRKALSKPQPNYTCNEQGTVAVEITVNSSGTVIEATPGVRPTTNTAKCLTDQAKRAALNTKFDANPGAPNQVGKIIYTFKLTD